MSNTKRMKQFSLLLLWILLSLTTIAQHLNVMSFNIRYSTAADSLNAWDYRKDFAASQVAFHDVDLLGIQEALASQVRDLQDRLKSHAYVGVGRDDGKEKGEFSAIFYNKDRLELLKSETFWLSETPAVAGSKSWDAAITRVVTWARFRDKQTKKEFYHFNTHFDHIGREARRRSATLLLEKINEIAGKMPVVVTGDFNARPQDEPIRVLTNAENPMRLTDSKELSETPHYGPGGTFTGFRSKEMDSLPIDYVFVKNQVKVKKHATLSQSIDGRYSSDHYPVFAQIFLP